MTERRILLIGCGILQTEIRWLIEKNYWPVDTFFLKSSLHVDFNKLFRSLCAALEKFQGRDIIVFYGCCHPLMDKILLQANTFRTMGQNCIDILLGYPRFMGELHQGAFFLLEEWARTWNRFGTIVFGTNPKAIRYVFQLHHKYLLCIRTPCSGDFKIKAEKISRLTGLPLRWTEVSLEHLEAVLQAAISRRKNDSQCRR